MLISATKKLRQSDRLLLEVRGESPPLGPETCPLFATSSLTPRKPEVGTGA